MSANEPLPAGVAVRRAAEAETLSAPIGSIQLLLDSSHTTGALSTQRVTLRAGVDGAPPHHHRRSTELFAVLHGELQLLTGEALVSLGAGDLLTIPPGLVHAFGAAAGRDADVLIVITPGVERFDYFRTLARIIAGQAPPDSLAAEQERYDTWFEPSEAWTRARGVSGAGE